MVFVDGPALCAFDGTGYFSSQKIHCDSCLAKHHRHGAVTYAHQLLGAALIHPDKRAVISLMPAPIVQQDGPEKIDCARNAAQRVVTTFRREHPHLTGMGTEDSLRSHAPHIATLHAHDMRYRLGVKEGDHAFLFQHVAEAEHAGRGTYSERHERPKGMHHRFRFVCDMPLNASHAALRVNFLECGETVPGTVQHFRWVTDWCVNQGTSARIMQETRARWRIDKETFNTRHNQGEHCEHPGGHGYQQRSVVFAELRLLAFLVDQVQQLCYSLRQAAWARWGSQRLRWEKMRALFFDYALESLRQRLEALYYGLKTSALLLATDPS